MLRITIELVPYGQESAKRTLSQFEIVNTGRTNSPDTYIVRQNRDGPAICEFKHFRDDGLNVCVGDALATLTAGGIDKI